MREYDLAVIGSGPAGQKAAIAAMHAFGAEVPRMSPRLPYGMYTIPEIAMIDPKRTKPRR